MTKPNEKTKVEEPCGRVLFTLDLFPMWKAETNPVGKGRENPNNSPFLPPPFGRLTFSLNPWTMFKQLVGPKIRRKLCCALCILLCIAYVIFMIPYCAYFISGEVINPFNYVKKK